jgi:hypothetical protein
MTARSGVSGETDRPFPVQGRVEVMVVVQDPEWFRQTETLLPINPLQSLYG